MDVKGFKKVPVEDLRKIHGGLVTVTFEYGLNDTPPPVKITVSSDRVGSKDSPFPIVIEPGKPGKG